MDLGFRDGGPKTKLGQALLELDSIASSRLPLLDLIMTRTCTVPSFRSSKRSRHITYPLKYFYSSKYKTKVESKYTNLVIIYISNSYLYSYSV